MRERERDRTDAELSQIGSIVDSSRRALRAAWVFSGAALCVGFFLAAVTAAVLLDLIAPLTVPLRAAALAVIVLITAVTFSSGVAGPALRRLSSIHMARRIERLIPQMQSRLVTAVDIAASSIPVASSQFRQRLIHETTERLGRFKPSELVDRVNVRRATVWSIGTIVIAGVIAVAFAPRIATTLARIFLPFADIPPATGVRIVAIPGDVRAMKGDELAIIGSVEYGRAAELTLETRSPGKRWARQPMRQTGDGVFETTFERLDQSFEYRVVGGGTWTKRHTISVIERPAINSVATVVHFPDYMKMPDQFQTGTEPVEVTGPTGSRIEVIADVSGSTVSGAIELLDPSANWRPAANRAERVWFEGKIPDGARPEGNWQWDYALKFRAAHTEPPVAGAHSHGFVGAANGFELRPDESIFAYVNVVPGQQPEEILIQMHDGKDWEHRAYWGADKIPLGTTATVSRQRIGELPAAGEWVRLEIPARAVGMAGKKLHGISFTLFGGQCKWNRTGAIDPAMIRERAFVVRARQPMEASPPSDETESSSHNDSERDDSDSRWSGSFPLASDGFYRIQFENQLGYASKPVKEAKFTAVADKPPQVALEKPGTDLVLSEPQKVPLFIRAYDDFGLSDIVLLVQKGDSGGFIGAPIKTYEDPVRSDVAIGSLDLEPHRLKPGEFVRYRVQARDRKGQIAQTQEFTVRIQPDNNAADRQLAALDQQQSELRRQLDQLIEKQSAITQSIDQLAGREPSAVSKPDGANANTAAEAAADPVKPNSPAGSKPATNPPVTPPSVQSAMSPQEQRQSLAQLAAPQNTNLQLAGQIETKLKDVANSAMNSKLMPHPIAAQLRDAEQLFHNEAVEPLRDLANSLSAAADSARPNPNPNTMADSAERVQKQLEAMRERLESLAQAQHDMRNQPAEALAQLQRNLMTQNAQMTARELADLREMIEKLKGRMQMLEGSERELSRQTEQALASLLPEIGRQQDRIEADAAEAIDQSDRMTNADELADSNRIKMPDSNSSQRSHDANEFDPMSPEETPKSKAANRSRGRDESDSEPLPAGVKPRMDSRLSKSNRQPPSPAAKSQADRSKGQNGSNADQPDRMRNELGQRQQQTMERLQSSQQDLQMPRERIEQLLEQLRQALEADESDTLASLMQSEQLQKAMQLAMASRKATKLAQNQDPNAPQVGQVSELNGSIPLGVLREFEANDVDLAAQTAILRMQPRVREELLKGMREEGPAAYRRFIQDYFNRLTKVRSGNE